MIGNTWWWLPGDGAIPFVECCQQDVVEMDRPDPVVGLLQSDLLVHHRVGELEQLLAPKPKGAARRDALDLKVPGILERRQAVRIGAR